MHLQLLQKSLYNYKNFGKYIMFLGNIIFEFCHLTRTGLFDNAIWKVSNLLWIQIQPMMILSNGNIFHVTDPLWGGSPSQRPVTWNFDVFFDLHLKKKKQLSKQTRCRWLEMPSHSLWCHCMHPLEPPTCCNTSMCDGRSWWDAGCPTSRIQIENCAWISSCSS